MLTHKLYDWVRKRPIGLWSRRAHDFLQHASAVSSSFGLTRLFNPTLFFSFLLSGAQKSAVQFGRVREDGDVRRDLPRASSSRPPTSLLPCFHASLPNICTGTPTIHPSPPKKKTKTSDREVGRVSLTRPYTKLTRRSPDLLTLPADLPTCNHLHRPLTSALFPILFFN